MGKNFEEIFFGPKPDYYIICGTQMYTSDIPSGKCVLCKNFLACPSIKGETKRGATDAIIGNLAVYFNTNKLGHSLTGVPRKVF